MTDQARAQPLPVLAFVFHSYASLLANWLTAVKLSWVWIAVSALLLWLLNNAVPDLDAVAQPTAPTALAIALMAAFLLALLFATASAAVGWHRMILLGAEPPRLGIDLGRRVRAYAWKLTVFSMIIFAVILVLGLLLWIPSFLISADETDGVIGPVAELLTPIAALLIFGYVAARYGLAFPAAALERSIGFGEAAKLAKGHIWPMTLGMVLVGLPDVIAERIFTEHVLGSAVAADVLRVTIYLLTMFAAFSLLSLCYRHIVMKPYASGTPPTQP